MGIEDDVTFLSRVPTLTLLGREALRILAIGAESRYIHFGETLFREGEAAEGSYVVQEGSFTLNASRANAGQSTVRVGAGALLGELAMLTETKRPATATANEPATVLYISRKLFLKMLEGYPSAAQRLRAAIEARAEQAVQDIVRAQPRFGESSKAAAATAAKAAAASEAKAAAAIQAKATATAAATAAATATASKAATASAAAAASATKASK